MKIHLTGNISFAPAIRHVHSFSMWISKSKSDQIIKSTHRIGVTAHIGLDQLPFASGKRTCVEERDIALLKCGILSTKNRKPNKWHVFHFAHVFPCTHHSDVQ